MTSSSSACNTTAFPSLKYQAILLLLLHLQLQEASAVDCYMTGVFVLDKVKVIAHHLTVFRVCYSNKYASLTNSQHNLLKKFDAT